MRRQRWGTKHKVAVLLALAAVGVSGPAARAYEQPPGTMSVGLGGGGGFLSGSGTYDFAQTHLPYQNYDLGPVLSIRLRYSLDPTHALGVSFQDLRFHRKSGVPSTDPRELQSVNIMGDYYLYFSRREKLCPLAVVGLGFHRDTFRYSGDENIIPPEGFVANLGTAVEYFIVQPLALEASVRGYYYRFRGGDGFAATAEFGFQYYLVR